MLEDFQAKKTDEYFISIAQQGLHSFIMLGVVVNGERKLLARIAKTRRPIDPYNPMSEIRSFLFSQVSTDLHDEGITRHDYYDPDLNERVPHTAEIKYSAYAITYQQTLDLIAFIEKANIRQPKSRGKEDKGCCSLLITEKPNDDLSNISFGAFNSGYVRVINQKTGINKLYYVDKRSDQSTELKLDADQLRQYDQQLVISTAIPQSISPKTLETLTQLSIHRHLNNEDWYAATQAIKAYKPIVESADNTLTFHYTSAPIMPPTADTRTDTLYEHTQHFNKNNSCRHTAVELLNSTRETTTPENISDAFYKSLPIKTTLVAGAPSQKRPFYILPLPPTAFQLEGQVTSDPAAFNKKQTLLKTLYHRMEKLIELESDSPLTQSKFDKLKLLYNQQAGKNDLSSQELLESIQSWRAQNPDINQLRKTNWVDSVLGLFGHRRHSATEKMFDDVEKMLNKPTPKKH